jgi:hypothetical protein
MKKISSKFNFKKILTSINIIVILNSAITPAFAVEGAEELADEIQIEAPQSIAQAVPAESPGHSKATRSCWKATATIGGIVLFSIGVATLGGSFYVLASESTLRQVSNRAVDFSTSFSVQLRNACKLQSSQWQQYCQFADLAECLTLDKFYLNNSTDEYIQWNTDTCGQWSNLIHQINGQLPPPMPSTQRPITSAQLEALAQAQGLTLSQEVADRLIQAEAIALSQGQSLTANQLQAFAQSEGTPMTSDRAQALAQLLNSSSIQPGLTEQQVFGNLRLGANDMTDFFQNCSDYQQYQQQFLTGPYQVCTQITDQFNSLETSPVIKGLKYGGIPLGVILMAGSGIMTGYVFGRF